MNTQVGVLGDSDADEQLEAIMTDHESALLRYATRLVNDPTTAQDVVQNVFLKVYRALRSNRRPLQLKSWLYRVTHNEAVDLIRRESRLRVLHARHEEERRVEDAGGRTDGSMSLEEKRELVLQLLARLHPREQQVVILRLEQGLSYQEISEITGRSEGNVGNILHHAVSKLSDALSKSGALS